MLANILASFLFKVLSPFINLSALGQQLRIQQGVEGFGQLYSAYRHIHGGGFHRAVRGFQYDFIGTERGQEPAASDSVERDHPDPRARSGRKAVPEQMGTHFIRDCFPDELIFRHHDGKFGKRLLEAVPRIDPRRETGLTAARADGEQAEVPRVCAPSRKPVQAADGEITRHCQRKQKQRRDVEVDDRVFQDQSARREKVPHRHHGSREGKAHQVEARPHAQEHTGGAYWESHCDDGGRQSQPEQRRRKCRECGQQDDQGGDGPSRRAECDSFPGAVEVQETGDRQQQKVIDEKIDGQQRIDIDCLLHLHPSRDGVWNFLDKILWTFRIVYSKLPDALPCPVWEDGCAPGRSVF